MTRGSRSDLQRVRDMRQAIAEIWEYRKAVQGMSDALPAGMLEHAVMDNLMIIGEAASRTTPETKKLAPEIAWRDMIAFRNTLVHWYHGRDLDIVEDTVQNDLPRLDAALARIEEQLTEQPQKASAARQPEQPPDETPTTQS